MKRSNLCILGIEYGEETTENIFNKIVEGNSNKQKRKSQKWGKIFTNYTSNRQLVSKICKELKIIYQENK